MKIPVFCGVTVNGVKDCVTPQTFSIKIVNKHIIP